jgi:F-type H+-transporting ATPase subunit delta
MAERITIARPYAKAVFQLARTQKQLPQWSTVLQTAASVVNDVRVAPLLGDPHVSPEQMAELIAGVVSDSSDGDAKANAPLLTQARNFIATLAHYRRLAFLPEIAAHFEQLRADAERTIDVTVTSAVALSDAQREQFAAAMRKRLDREVHLHCELDPALLGGAVIRADDLVIDGSVRASLTQLAAVAAS